MKTSSGGVHNKPFVLFLMLLGLLIPALKAEDAVYKDPHATAQARVDDLLGRLTLEEKIDLIGGNIFTLKGNARLGIPAFVTSDASMGVRNYGKATAYPNGVALASTWDVNLARKVGVSIGRDARARGVHFLLGPGMNLYRAPMCGRNFEYLGEDPVLAGNIASQFIQGVQSQQVAVTAKHFVANEQEVNRHDISSNVDERTLRELYLMPFETVVKNGAWGVMGSYNLINGVHASQNDWLLNKVLKGEWGFQGLVFSDWESCYDALEMANGGLDLEMPSGKYFNANILLPLIKEGKIQTSVIDDKVRRQLLVAFSLGWFDRPQLDASIPKDDPSSDAIALEGARESVTLLKNDPALLPLDLAKVKKIVVLGHNADPAVTGGGGSAFVDAFHSVSVFQGIKDFVGPAVKVTLVPWKRKSAPQSSLPGDKSRPEALDANGAEGTPPIPAKYVEEVKSADAVIVCAGFSQSPGGYRDADPKKFDQEGEAGDRPYTLPPGQKEVIQAATRLNPHTIVIFNSGGSVATSDWIHQVPVFIDAFYPGQNGGTALAEILFGKISPSGKLPFSWEKRWEDSAAYGNYPVYGDKVFTNDYLEGVFLGYRWFDAKQIEPLFPFGYGLSYTTFDISNLKLSAPEIHAGDSLNATIEVKNTGSREGAEVVQLYVSDPSATIPRPPQELKGFERVFLKPGETRSVEFTLHPRDFSYWDEKSKTWKIDPGHFIIRVGNSSRDLKNQAPLNIL